MAKLKRRLATILGIVVAIVTLRFLRNRDSESIGESGTEAETEDLEGHEELETATGHAMAAVEHARVATTKAVQSVREETEPVQAVSEETETGAEAKTD